MLGEHCKTFGVRLKVDDAHPEGLATYFVIRRYTRWVCVSQWLSSGPPDYTQFEYHLYWD